MAKPKQESEEPVSLFPFLSILACLIGVLTFIITGVAISQMDQSEDLAAIERIEKYGPLVEQLDADQRTIQQHEELVNAQQALEKQITRVQTQIKQAKNTIAQQQDREKTLKQVQSIRQQITKVDQQIKTAKPQLTKLQAKVTQDQVELDKRIEAGKPVGTVVRPAGSGINLKPNFIECTKKHITLYSGSKRIKIELGKFAQDKRYIGLLDRVAKLEKERVVFLLRPDGVQSYNAAASIARQRQCRYGKIPVPGEGPIDLQMFD